LFENDVKPLEKQVTNGIKHSLTQSQFDAMVDFGFNVGSGSLNLILTTWNSTGSAKQTAERMLAYNKTTVNGKKVISGELVSRRAENAAMFLGASAPALPIVGLVVSGVIAILLLR
jgi:lysozyme